MTIELRPATESEMEQFGRATSYAYGGASGDGADNFLLQVIRPEWTMFAFDGPKVAATFSTIPSTMRANGLALAMGGVCCASTEPEYRRQGLLRQIMTQELNRMGRPLLQLCARPQVPEKTQPASWKNPVDSTNSGAGRQPGTAAIHDQVAPLRCCT